MKNVIIGILSFVIIGIIIFTSSEKLMSSAGFINTTSKTNHVISGDLYIGGSVTCIGDMSNYAGISVDNNTTETEITLKNSWFQFLLFDSNSEEKGSDGDYTSNNITVNLSGNYEVEFNAAGESSGMNKAFEFRVFKLMPIIINITDATQADPIVITTPGHTFSNGNKVAIKLVGGMIEINDRIFTVQDVSGSTFELTDDGGTSPGDDIDATEFAEYTTGGTIQLANETRANSPRTFSGGNANFGSYSGSDFVSLETNCTLEYYIKCLSDATNFIQKTCILKIKKL